MKKSLEFRPDPLLFTLLLIFFFTMSLHASTYVVDKNAICIGNWCRNTCENSNFSTLNKDNIQDAINDASARDTISICDGTYTEELEIKDINNLTLIKSASATGSVIVQSSNTILKIDGIDGLTVDSIEFGSSDETAIEIKNWSNDILFKNLLVNSNNEDAIKIKDAMGTIDIQNTTITAGMTGIKVEKELNGFFISNSSISASKIGMEFKKKLNGFVTISNISVKANNGDGIKFDEDINNGILIEASEINSAKKGIKFKKNVYGNFNINDVVVYADDEGISIGGGQADPIIKNSNITSKEKDAIKTKSNDWTNFKLQNTCVTTEKNDKYGFNLDISNLNAGSEIKNNCFYAPNVNKLAYADGTGSGSKFNGNYWDGVTGNYTQNNISDTSPLGSCPNSCGGVVAASQTINLGILTSFEAYTGAGAVTNSGGTVTGDIGTNLGIISGFISPPSTGNSYAENDVTDQVRKDLMRMYIHLNDLFVDYPGTHTAAFGAGETIGPGVYYTGGAGSIGGALTLDGGGNPDALFVIQMNGALTVGSGAVVNLTGGTKSCNVFWIANGAISVAENANIKGTLFSKVGAVGLGAGAVLEGRMLTMAGAITMGLGSTVKPPPCDSTIPIFCEVDCTTADAVDVLGALSDFALYTSAGAVANTGISGVNGEIGTPGAISGYTTGIHIGDENLTAEQAKEALDNAYIALMDLNNTVLGHTAAFGLGETLTTGVYFINGAGSLGGTITLDGQNNPDAIFVFKFAGAFNVAAASKIILANGAKRCNIFWLGGAGVATGAVNIGAGSIVKGNFFSHGGASNSGAGVFLAGRQLSTLGAVNTDAGIIYTDPECVTSESLLTPIAEYRFDECDAYDGTEGEVTNSSGYDNDGTSKNGANTELNTVSGGGLGKVGKFDGSNDYVELPNFPDMTENFSILAQFKTENINKVGQRIFADDETASNGYAISFGDGGAGRVRFYDRSQSGSGIIDTDSVIENNQWYFVSAINDKTNSIRHLYIYDANGTQLDHKTLNINNNRGSNIGMASIGGETDISGETLNRFIGNIDEVKVFELALTQSQIEDIVNNEKDGKNWDGNDRDIIDCGLNVCYTDDFNRATLGNVWSLIKSKNYTSQIVDNKLILTPNTGNVATGVSLNGDFPSADNLVEVEFEHNAYAGTGADGVTVVLSDSTIAPVAGGYGGSLGYSPKGAELGFAGAWLGFGLDEYGNFANDSDGNQGRGCAVRNRNRVLDSVTIRGAGEDNRLDGYCFIANSGGLTPGIDDISSSTPAPNNLYKFIVDTRGSDTIITVQRDIRGGTGYVTLPNMDTINATQAAIAPDSFKFSLTGSTGGSRNVHSFDDLKISAKHCGTLGDAPDPEDAQFDAWNTDTDHTNKYISTKIVNQPFNLVIGSLNADFSGTQEFTGTVCAQIIDHDYGTVLSAPVPVYFDSVPTVDQNFIVTKASKKAKVALSWKADVDSSCPLASEDNSTILTELFAIRPEKFSFIPSSSTEIYALETFMIEFSALDSTLNNTLDYNEIKNSSFEIDASITKSGCADGTLEVADFTFGNGFKSVDSNYSDIGDVNVTIKEILGNEYALIDKLDTSDENRLITPYSSTITIKPYELNVTNVQYSNTMGSDWLYMADVDDLNQTVKSTIVANDKLHNKVQNFTDICYAEDMSVTTNFSVENSNSGVEIKYDDGTIVNIEDINKTILIPKNAFINSQADINYDFNIQRDYKTPYNPIKIGLSEVNIISIGISKIVNNAAVDMNSTFYYGRVKTEDINTNKQSIPHDIHVEVYSSDNLSGLKQNSLNWYQNEMDTNTSGILFQEKKSFSFIGSKNGINTNNIKDISDGNINFDLENTWTSSDSAMIHLNIPVWLWYSKYNAYDASVDCSNHPCFEYSYIKADTNSSIKSGTFNGSSIGRDFNATNVKRGVKTFR